MRRSGTGANVAGTPHGRPWWIEAVQVNHFGVVIAIVTVFEQDCQLSVIFFLLLLGFSIRLVPALAFLGTIQGTRIVKVAGSQIVGDARSA